MTTVTITQEQFDTLEALYPKICALKQILEPVVNTSIMNEISSIQNAMQEVFKTFWEKNEEDFDTNFDALCALQKEHNIDSFWSISEVPAKAINTNMPGKVKKITYTSGENTQEIILNPAKTMTWFEMWKEADKLIAQSGDSHHCFVENFNEDNKNPEHYNLVTGS